MSTFWEEMHEDYSSRDWSKMPSLFAQEVIGYFPKASSILELGCGQGQDGLWFAQNTMTVTATDNEQSALNSANNRRAELGVDDITFEILDLEKPFPYQDESFDVVYSHLALHYFSAGMTERIFNEIYRVLKPGGTLAFLVNSVNDPEYNTGTKIEDGYFETEGTTKRYFSAESARNFAKEFDVVLCDENGETYKDRDKGVHNLVRFVGRKAS